MNAAAGFLGKAAAKARDDLQDLRQKSNQLSQQVSGRLRGTGSGSIQDMGDVTPDICE